MRRGYKTEIRTKVVTLRLQNKDWDNIRFLIKQEYDVSPSIRQMQKWVGDYNKGTDDPTGAKYVSQVIEETANMAQPLAQAKMMADVMPLWSKLQNRSDISSTDAGWIAFLSFFEAQIGRRDFDRIVKRYREIRDEIK